MSEEDKYKSGAISPEGMTSLLLASGGQVTAKNADVGDPCPIKATIGNPAINSYTRLPASVSPVTEEQANAVRGRFRFREPRGGVVPLIEFKL